jgi:hypothetical protein
MRHFPNNMIVFGACMVCGCLALMCMFSAPAHPVAGVVVSGGLIFGLLLSFVGAIINERRDR